MPLRLPEGARIADLKALVPHLRSLHRWRSGKKRKRRRPPGVRALAALGWGQSIAGFAVAEKHADKHPTGQLCIRFYVRRKVGRSRLDPSDRIPSHINIARGKQTIAIPTNVIEMRVLPQAQRSIPAGASIGHFSGVTDGTLGLAVVDSNGQVYALTCRHVACPWWMDPQGAAIECPPDRDGQPGPNVIGKVYSWTILSETAPNDCDAALVIPLDGVVLNNGTLQLHPSLATAFGISDFSADPRRKVQIFTRRKVISGVVESVCNHLDVDILQKAFPFQNVVEVAYQEPLFSGDSGSAVIQTDTRAVLGLHFAGVPNSGTGYFIPAPAIASRFRKFGLRPL